MLKSRSRSRIRLRVVGALCFLAGFASYVGMSFVVDRLTGNSFLRAVLNGVALGVALTVFGGIVKVASSLERPGEE
jgi:hypothetical protein